MFRLRKYRLKLLVLHAVSCLLVAITARFPMIEVQAGPIESVCWGWNRRAVRIIDQRRLPGDFVERYLTTLREIRDAIETLAVRGAPAIGICGAMGLSVSLIDHVGEARDLFLARAARVAREIAATRPTAVNLAWAVHRVLDRAERTSGKSADILEAMRQEATTILAEDRAMCLRIGEAGAGLLRDNARVLTHCNAGALATGGLGTALAPIYVATSRGRRIFVLATETRPLLQGSRLTAWELTRAGIPVTVITDGAAASRMRAGGVDLCIVGADRVVANGDVANKVGTYALAVVARHHGIPFYVAMPSSTIDASLPSGDHITIEERDPAEVSTLGERRVAPEEAAIGNAAFDVTPAALVTAFITDRGIVYPPYSF